MVRELNKRILVIDDSLDTQTLLRILLESMGYSVDCASNGAEALDHLSSSNELPDLILVDLRMPVMGGAEFISSQQKILRFKNIPTVVISADDDAHTIAAKAAGVAGTAKASRILMKPLTIASVLSTIERSLALH